MGMQSTACMPFGIVQLYKCTAGLRGLPGESELNVGLSTVGEPGSFIESRSLFRHGCPSSKSTKHACKPNAVEGRQGRLFDKVIYACLYRLSTRCRLVAGPITFHSHSRK